MIPAVAILCSATLLSVGLIIVRRAFYRLAESTTGLLNALLNDEPDEMVKHGQVVTAVGRQLGGLGIFLLAILAVLAVAALPLMLPYGGEIPPAVSETMGQWPGILALLAGGTVPFIVFSYMSKKKDYSEWSILLHRMVLNNEHLGARLFAWDARRFKRKHSIERTPPLLVSGLARSGTTALTTILARSERLHSLSYAHMPFLLAPYTWGRWVKPSQAPLKERSHGDKVLVGFSSVEALEEYFFKVFLKGKYISAQGLHEHDLDERTHEQYVTYRALIGRGRPGSIYLAKNNNAILRYSALRKLEPEMKVVFLFRDPLEHAFSLMKQHQRFSKMQADDPFVLEYMNWLGHHEFGQGLKGFLFNGDQASSADTNSIEHWLRVWIHYYTHLLPLLENDEGVLLIDYAEFLRDPKAVVQRIGELIGSDLQITDIALFENANRYEGEVNADVLADARALHMRLQARTTIAA